MNVGLSNSFMGLAAKAQGRPFAAAAVPNSLAQTAIDLSFGNVSNGAGDQFIAATDSLLNPNRKEQVEMAELMRQEAARQFTQFLSRSNFNLFRYIQPENPLLETRFQEENEEQALANDIAGTVAAMNRYIELGANATSPKSAISSCIDAFLMGEESISRALGSRKSKRDQANGSPMSSRMLALIQLVQMVQDTALTVIQAQMGGPSTVSTEELRAMFGGQTLRNKEKFATNTNNLANRQADQLKTQLGEQNPLVMMIQQNNQRFQDMMNGDAESADRLQNRELRSSGMNKISQRARGLVAQAQQLINSAMGSEGSDGMTAITLALRLVSQAEAMVVVDGIVRSMNRQEFSGGGLNQEAAQIEGIKATADALLYGRAPVLTRPKI